MPISYSRILVSPEVAEFLEQEPIGKDQNWQDWLQDKFLFPSHGLYLKPIDDNIFSARTNIKKRLLLVFVKDLDGNDVPYIFNHYEDHKLERPQDKDLYKKYNKQSPEIKDIENPTVIDLGSTQTIIYQPEIRQIGVGKKSKKFPKLIAFDRDQCEIETYLRQLYQQEQPYCVNSIAGSGKTCLALLQLANIAQDLALQPEQEKLIYLTKSPHLAARQQKEFAKSYPQLVDRVEFLSYNQFLERNKKEGTLKIATYQNFLAWYQTQVGVNKDKKFKGKQYPQSETLYDEFNHLSGNYDSQEKYLDAPASHCSFNKKLSEQDSSSEDQQELNREDILELYKSYQESLFTQGVVDPIRVELEEDLIKSLAIIVDEAQLLTKKDCEKIKLLSKTLLQFFCDSNQGPITFKPEHLSEDLSASQQLTLSTNHRSSKHVIAFAELILEKISELGVVGDAKLNIAASQKSEEGKIDWQISNKAVFSKELTQEIKNNPDIYLIITTDDKKDEVQKLFPENVVMTPVECQGIEYPKVILFECVSDSKDKAGERSRVVGVGSKPKKKDADVLKKIKNLRILFSIITRAQESIIVINSDNKGVQFLREELGEKITKSLSQKQETLTKQSSDEDDLSKPDLRLSTPAKHIIAAARIYSSQANPEVLRQQVVAALKGIKEGYGKNEIHIKSLTKLIQENYDDLTEELCQEIFEALYKNIGNIELYNILLSQNFNFSQIPDNADLMISINGSKLFILIMQSKDQDQIKRLLQNRKPLEDKKFTSENIDLLRDANLSEENFGLLLQFLNPKFENVGDLRNDLEKAENGDRHQEKLAIFFNHFTKNGKLKEHIKKQIKEIISNGAKPQPFILDFLKPEGILNIWQEMMKTFSTNVDDLCYLIENYHQHILPDDNQETIKTAFSQQSNKGNSEEQIIKFIASITKVKSAGILSERYSDKLTLLGKIMSTVAGLKHKESGFKEVLIEEGIIPEKKEIVNDKKPKKQKKPDKKSEVKTLTINYPEGDSYNGQLKNNRPDGIGEMKYKNGDIHKGLWENGKFLSGNIKHKGPDHSYEGGWEDGKINGQGKMTYKNGDIREGLWKNGELLSGIVRHKDQSGDIYEGGWKDGKPHGQGKITYKNGNILDGEWQDGECLSGKVKYYKDGVEIKVYEGELKNAKPNGQGKMTYANGNVYEGNWEGGERKGKGKMTFVGGTYDGCWENDQMYGGGKMTYANGDVYEGQWQEDYQWGEGKMTYQNGNIYNGEWQGGFMLQGEMIYKNGNIYNGTWGDNERFLSGTVTHKYLSGDVYEGEWENNRPCGQGKMIYENGDVYEGEWINGQFLSGTLKLDDNYIREQKWEDGKIISTLVKLKLDDGSYEGRMVNGAPNGDGKMIYANGNIYQGEWKDGKPDGVGKMTYKNGDVYEGKFEDGNRNGIGKMTYANGDIYAGEWKGGDKNGRGIEVRESHQIIGTFLANKPSGSNIRISEGGFIALYSGESPQFLDVQKGVDAVIDDVSKVIDPKKNDELPSRILGFSKAFSLTTGVISTVSYLADISVPR